MLGWELPPHNSGGLGVACFQLCKSLAERGASIEFILPYQAQHNAHFMKVTAAQPQTAVELLASGIAYDSYKYIHPDGTIEWVDIFAQAKAYEKAVEKLVEFAEFDVIHAHDWLTFRAALRAKEQTGKPMILHIHSTEKDRAGGHKGNPLVREIEQQCLLLADKVIAVSHQTKQAIIHEYGIPAGLVEVVHNSIDLADVPQLEGDNAYSYIARMKQEGYRVVVNVGRLTIQKGLPNLLRAAQKVVQIHPKTLFLIVGSGEQYHELVMMSAELGISKNVVFTNFQRGKRLRDAYAISDLFVMPSISEPFGLTPLEAIGYGSPTLISKQSGVAEVINNSLKVDFWDVDEMANQIASVMRHDELRNELHRNAYLEYEKLSWNKAADTLMGLYTHHQQRIAA